MSLFLTGFINFTAYAFLETKSNQLRQEHSGILGFRCENASIDESCCTSYDSLRKVYMRREMSIIPYQMFEKENKVYGSFLVGDLGCRSLLIETHFLILIKL